MFFSDKVLRNDEKAIYSLRELYRKYGYTQFKVSRFEEYDLYARNKSFLVNENVLTFTDTNGKLMALKPDVTLSIIKNIATEDLGTHKLYYNENVYRPSPEAGGFKEIMQTGLECVGNVDLFSTGEVIMLAAKSLEVISDDYILDVSHMGLVEGLMDGAGVADEDRATLLSYVKSKNTAAIEQFGRDGKMSASQSNLLCELTKMYLPLEDALEAVKNSALNDKMSEAYNELVGLSEIMKAYGLDKKLYLDLSVVNDRNYYDGIIFKGFINGIPDGVLSGGRYNKLLEKMGKKCGAIGFAVYLDRLERFGHDEGEYDVDALLIYDNDVRAEDVICAVRELGKDGRTVMTSASVDKSIRCRQTFRIKREGVSTLETDD